MINIALGGIAVLFGLWLMFANWWATIDLLKTLFPMLLAAYGVVALMAGVKNFGHKIAGVGDGKE